MRIRITEVNSFQPPHYGDHPLYHFGVAVGYEFEVVDVHGCGFIVETDDGPLFIRRSECEVLEGYL